MAAAKRDRHGLHALDARFKRLGGRGIDRRTRAGRALDDWRKRLEADLGGAAALSAQQLALVDVATRTKALLDHVDRWLLDQGGAIVNRRRRSLVPVMRERQDLAESLSRVLGQLGLERKAPPAPSLIEHLRRGGASTAPAPRQAIGPAADGSPVEGAADATAAQGGGAGVNLAGRRSV